MLGEAPTAAERWAVALLLLWLLIGPRIELAGLRGLRVEDLVFAVLAVLCLRHARSLLRPAGPTLAVLGVVVTGLISTVVATARGTVDPVTAVLFAVRPLEYWIAFPAALLLLRGAGGRWLPRIDALLALVTVLQTAFAVMQYYFGLQVGFSHAAYTRAAGLTVGPYELGAISAALAVYWVRRGWFSLAALAVIALAASISRVSLLGAGVGLGVLVVAWFVTQGRAAARNGLRSALHLHGRSRLRVAGEAVSVLAAALVLAFTLGLIHLPAPAPGAVTPDDQGGTTSAAPADDADAGDAPEDPGSDLPDGEAAPEPGPVDSIGQRLATTSVLGSWNAAAGLAEAVPPVRTAAEYQDVAFTRLNEFVDLNAAAAAGAEASNLVRFFRWHLILNTIDDPVDLLVGLGPSFVGPSVDGSYLRMLADGGMLGVLAWIALIVTWLRRSPLWMWCVTLSVLVGALFIDIVYAQRPMVLFWMLLAIAVVRRESGALERPASGGAHRSATRRRPAAADQDGRPTRRA